MVFDAGLHVDPSSLKLTERETQIRHMVLWACLITDKLVTWPLGIDAHREQSIDVGKDTGRFI
jgi:hypothetical protein